jgi:hypothetical protein
VQEWGLERCVYLMLALTEKMLGHPMPIEIQAKINPDSEVLNAVSAAEEMIFKTDMGVSKFVARLFGEQRWRMKVKIMLERAFPSKGVMYIPKQSCAGLNYFNLFRLYFLRMKTLLRRHKKIIWSGLSKDPKTIRALELENKKNNLRDWLTHTSNKKSQKNGL